MLVVNLAHGFVGGAHGGHSGGGGHGGFSGSSGHAGSSTQSYSTSDPTSIIHALAIYGLILIVILLHLWLKTNFHKTILGLPFKRHKQKKYIKKCRFTPLKPKHLYASEEVAHAISILKLKAMEAIKELNYLSDKTHDQLVKKALKSFERLQKAWGARNINRVFRACNNRSFSNKLCNQINKMASLDVYNYIDKTVITECHLVKFYKPGKSYASALRFVVKGEQIDEYTTQEYSVNPGIFASRKFNCLVDVIPYKGQFKIYQVKMEHHTDDYVIKEFKKL